MSNDLMDYNGEVEVHETYTQRCDICEREVMCSSDTGEPLPEESCGDMSCEILSQEREGGDPQPLDFNDSGC